MKTSRFILAMVTAWVLAVFIASCGLSSDLAPSATQSSTTAVATATMEPYPSGAIRPFISTPMKPVVATPPDLEGSYPASAAPTTAPAIFERPTPTPVPASWETSSDSTLQIEFRYPAEWQAEAPLKLRGADGFVEVSLQDYHASLFDVMRTVCVLEANANRPAAYGAGPLISNWSGWDPDRQNWAGSAYNSFKE